MMWLSVVLATAMVFQKADDAVPVRERNELPPPDSYIIGFLEQPHPWVTRTVESIEREEINQGRWKCTVIYRDGINLFQGRIRFSTMAIHIIYIDD